MCSLSVGHNFFFLSFFKSIEITILFYSYMLFLLNVYGFHSSNCFHPHEDMFKL